MDNVHFSSKSIEWSTPQGLFDILNDEFFFTLDVCATDENRKCDKYFSILENGLIQAWDGVCWMNPPYGREIGLWVEKAYRESLNGVIVVCLIPARTDTKWWHSYAMRSSEIRFLKGRVTFGGAKKGAPFPSVILVFDNKKRGLNISAYEVNNVKATNPGLLHAQ